MIALASGLLQELRAHMVLIEAVLLCRFSLSNFRDVCICFSQLCASLLDASLARSFTTLTRVILDARPELSLESSRSHGATDLCAICLEPLHLNCLNAHTTWHS